MIPNLRRRLSLVLFVLGFCVAPLGAQIQVAMKMSKSDYVANEAVQAVLTLTNRTGQDVTLHSEGPRSWLDFVIKNERGVPLSPIRGMVIFKAVHLPAGRSVAKTFTLSHHYRVAEYGRYNGYAAVRMPGTGSTTLFTSNRVHFEVTKARTIYSQKVGMPGTKSFREYRAMNFINNQKTHLYIEVLDESSGRSLNTFSLGEILMFQKPSFMVDGENNLHVLHLTTPSMFTHCTVNREGRLLDRTYFKRAQTGSPRFMTFANGDVRVAGGVPYDPKVAAANRAKIKRLSERPPFAYR